jgi:curli biogenesis system outer membrane secretion channel CsgG
MNNPEKSLVVALCLSVFYPGLAFSQPAAPAAPAQSATDTKSGEKAAAYYAQLVKACAGSTSDRPELGRARALLAKK